MKTYCGSAQQWAQFDKTMAQSNNGVSCRQGKRPQEVCLFTAQWQYVDRMKSLTSRAKFDGFGDEARLSAMAIEHNEYNAVRQDLLDSAGGRPLPIP